MVRVMTRMVSLNNLSAQYPRMSPPTKPRASPPKASLMKVTTTAPPLGLCPSTNSYYSFIALS